MHDGYIDPLYASTTDEWYVPYKYYAISEICGYRPYDPYMGEATNHGFVGIRLTFSARNAFTGWPDETHLFGTTSPNVECESSIGKNVVKAKVCVRQSADYKYRYILGKLISYFQNYILIA